MTEALAEERRLFPDGFRFIRGGVACEIEGICECTYDDDESDIRYSYFHIEKTHQSFCASEQFVASHNDEIQVRAT